ncbi:hypothetical protein CDL60_07215 [Roseateles noduli]|nr:hypothetical protein CDL60_07215 [Roseateles noduli]
MFGRTVDELQEAGVFERLNTFNRPALTDSDDGASPFHDWVLVRRMGVELGFTEAAYQSGIGPVRGWGHGELLFTQAYFYSRREDIEDYGGALPFGLMWSDSRQQARAKLFDFEASRHSSGTDTWDVPGYRLTAVYTNKGAQLNRVVCRVLPDPLVAPAQERGPSLKTVVESLGEPVSEIRLRSDWKDILNADRIAEGEESGTVDVMQDVGVSVGLAATESGGIIRAVTLHRNRDQDSTGWQGELPFGLSFEDSAEELFAKVRVPPAQQESSELTAHAVWHLPACSLHILYSNVDNRLIRVKLMSPGTWRSVHDEC